VKRQQRRRNSKALHEELWQLTAMIMEEDHKGFYDIANNPENPKFGPTAVLIEKFMEAGGRQKAFREIRIYPNLLPILRVSVLEAIETTTRHHGIFSKPGEPLQIPLGAGVALALRIFYHHLETLVQQASGLGPEEGTEDGERASKHELGLTAAA
jgi:hypothetical protein